MSGIERVGVVGLGLMGSGIAEVCARAGLEVHVAERDAEALDAGLARIDASLDRGLRRGKMIHRDRDDATSKIIGTTSLAALADCQFVIEAATEDAAAKLAIFAALDETVQAPGAILASNTSSIPIATIATATKRPQQVIGVHFFNPAPVMALVELIPTLLTSPETSASTRHFVERTLGKTSIQAEDRAGFVVNALLIPYLMSAVRMLEAGHASAHDIDTAMTLGAAHPMGPLHLLDLIGLDTAVLAAQSLYDEYHEPHHAAPPLLRRMVESGLLGRKTGRGFFTYTSEGKLA